VIIASSYFIKTQLGYSLGVYGNNPVFFSHYGISRSYVFIGGVLTANALAGLSGYLFAQANNFAELTMGFGKPLLCITVLVLGKIMIPHTQQTILIPLTGTIIYFTMQQLLLKVGFNLKYFTALQSLIVLICLILFYKRSFKKTDHLGV
jgi:putative ABC transport system permease protein